MKKAMSRAELKIALKPLLFEKMFSRILGKTFWFMLILKLYGMSSETFLIWSEKLVNTLIM